MRKTVELLLSSRQRVQLDHQQLELLASPMGLDLLALQVLLILMLLLLLILMVTGCEAARWQTVCLQRLSHPASQGMSIGHLRVQHDRQIQESYLHKQAAQL